MWSSLDIILAVFIVVAILFAAFYFLNKWASKKYGEQQNIIEKTKMSATIYVIDKKMDKVTNVNLPKAVQDQMPKMYKFMKMPFVKAKIGPQIMTLMCDKAVFKALPIKKNISVEIAGIYIVSMKGMKSEKEMKAKAKEKKQKEKENKIKDKAEKGK